MQELLKGESPPDIYWSRVNCDEAATDILSPLCWSYWRNGIEWGTRAGWSKIGLLSPAQVMIPQAPSERIVNCFYGRMAINVHTTCRLMGAVPGASPEDIERDLLGSVRTDAPTIEPMRIPKGRLALKGITNVIRHTTTVRRLHAEQFAWWSHIVANEPASSDLRLYLDESLSRFCQAMEVHTVSRTFVLGAQARLSAATRKAGRPDLFLSIFSGFGGVVETDLAHRIWEIRTHRKEPGPFLARYGFHGIHEGNLTGRSWRECPSSIFTDYTVQSTDSPAALATRAAAAHADSMRELKNFLSRRERASVYALCRFAAVHIRNSELTKEMCLMAIDAARLGARRVGRQLEEQGIIDDVEDVFMCTWDELRPEVPPHELSAQLHFRRSRMEEYRGIEIPIAFKGMPTVLEKSEPSVLPGEGLQGIAAASGRTIGRARVLTAPNQRFTPGDVLVCRVCDPSWTPVIMLAAGLVIDVGGTASHAAIIARELGIPCVIGTRDGTKRILTNTLVHVDGDGGVVRPVDDLDGI
ncbi:PEP-utilizing enzyme [Nocardia sp. NPDC052316]|uniref:PEP-utilizing enzyme n=1 Tax=Nocardia sp. NPDC052316 TaxID=3364329 RepID=UPI0037CB284B